MSQNRLVGSFFATFPDRRSGDVAYFEPEEPFTGDEGAK